MSYKSVYVQETRKRYRGDNIQVERENMKFEITNRRETLMGMPVKACVIYQRFIFFI